MLEFTADLIRAESPAILVLLATSLVALGERRVQNYNYDYLETVGGEELIPTEMKAYYRWILWIPFIAAFSALLLPREMVPFRATVPGLALIFAGFLWSTWSMRRLGRLWTQRCIYIPDMPREGRGPYRIMRHPEYTGRAIGGLGFVLFFGFNPLSLLAWLWSFILLARILKVESRQLHELSAAPLQLVKGSSTVGASKSR